MVSNTHDWTKNTPWAEYPMMKSIYKLYHAADHVKYAYFDYPHNYNKASREAVYKWFHRWMPGDADQPPTQEQPFTVDPASKLLVFLKQPLRNRDLTFQEMDPSLYHDLPKGALQMDAAAMLRYLKKQARQTLANYWPTKKSQWSRFDSVYGVAYRHILADTVPQHVHAKAMSKGAGASFRWKKLMIERGNRHDWIPAILFQPPKQAKQSKYVTLIVAPRGKSAIANSSGAGPNRLVQRLLNDGQSVMAIDAFKTGEHVLPKGVTTARDESEPRFTTFNKTDTQERIQDILTSGKFLENRFPGKSLKLVGLHQAGVWATLAAPLAPMFKMVIGDEDQLNPKQANQLLSSFFVPGLLRYGNVQTALALAANQGTRMTIYNVNPSLNKKKMKAVFKLFGHPKNLSMIRKQKLSRETMVRLLDQE
jgi:hypothetical protein